LGERAIRALLLEEIPVCTRALEDDLVFLHAVDQKPVGREMTFPMVRPLPFERVISVLPGERLTVD
jgi:hypothetical protein